MDKTYEIYANIGKLITSSIEIDEVLTGIMEEVWTFFNPQNWSFLRYDQADEILFFSIVMGVEEEEVRGVEIKKGQGIAGTVAETWESIFIPDVFNDARFDPVVDKITGFTTRSIIAVPCIFRGELYGVIEIINWEEGRCFTEEDHLVLKTISDFSAIAIANAVRFHNVLETTLRDPLTGAGNRKLLEQLADSWESEGNDKRESDSLKDEEVLVVYIDLDDFKQINDTLGHNEGDRILMETARRIKASIRDDDYCIRTGGDEFVVIITSLHEVQHDVIARIKSSLEEGHGAGPRIDASMGYARGPRKRLSSIINDADRNMYSQKEGGNSL